MESNVIICELCGKATGHKDIYTGEVICYNKSCYENHLEKRKEVKYQEIMTEEPKPADHKIVITDEQDTEAKEYSIYNCANKYFEKVYQNNGCIVTADVLKMINKKKRSPGTQPYLKPDQRVIKTKTSMNRDHQLVLNNVDEVEMVPSNAALEQPYLEPGQQIAILSAAKNGDFHLTLGLDDAMETITYGGYTSDSGVSPAKIVDAINEQSKLFTASVAPEGHVCLTPYAMEGVGIDVTGLDEEDPRMRSKEVTCTMLDELDYNPAPHTHSACDKSCDKSCDKTCEKSCECSGTVKIREKTCENCKSYELLNGSCPHQMGEKKPNSVCNLPVKFLQIKAAKVEDNFAKISNVFMDAITTSASIAAKTEEPWIDIAKLNENKIKNSNIITNYLKANKAAETEAKDPSKEHECLDALLSTEWII